MDFSYQNRWMGIVFSNSNEYAYYQNVMHYSAYRVKSIECGV